MSKPKTMRIPFFKKGKHIDNSGHAHEFTESELKAVAASYDPTKYTTPLVIGHPEKEDPAYGHVTAIEYDESTHELVAIADATDATFAEDVNAGKYGKNGSVSAAWYAKNNPNNPIKDGWYPRHIGFLGAVPPAVKGLSPLEFNDGNDFVVYTFSEAKPKDPANPADPTDPSATPSNEDDKKKIQALSTQLAELREIITALKATKDKEETARTEAENAEFCEALIKDGKLLPKQRTAVLALLNGAPTATLEFNDAERPYGELLKDLLDSAPSYDFGEQATKGKSSSTAESSFEYDEGTPEETIALDQSIRRYMVEHKVEYTEAYQAVTSQ